MPKRTNAFQTVIFLVKSNIAGQATVTESAELTDLQTGDKREVDVVIETIVAGHAMLISVECRDHSRRQTVEWVESMHAGHSSLPTNRLVLVSRSGFTSQALKKARLYNIETVVPDEFTEDHAAEIGARVSRVQLGRVEMVRITKVRTTVAAIREPITVLPEARGLPVFIETGRCVALMGDIVTGFLTSYGPGQVLVHPPGHIQTIEVRANNPRMVIDDEPQALYLKVPEREPPLSRLEQISIAGEARHESSDVLLRHGKFQDIVYSWGEVTLEGKPVIVVATEADDGTTTVSLGSF